MISARIPFAGFYYSMWDREIDSWIDQQSEHTGVPVEDIKLDYGAAKRGIAKAYTEAFAEWLAETLEKPVTLEYEELSSPKYYNFETDRIFAKGVVFADILTELRSKDADTLAKAFRDAFTSRDGFISFYEPVVPSKPIGDWDHNEVYILLLAWIDHQGVENIDSELFEGLCEKIAQICDESCCNL